MATNPVNLPAGFQLDQNSSTPAPQSSSAPSLPQGFVLDQQPNVDTGITGQDIAQHPFQSVAKTIIQPAAKSLTGQSLEDQQRQADLKNAGNTDFKGMNADEIQNKLGDVQDSTFKNALLAQAGDAASTPATYVGGKLVEGAGNIIKGAADAVPNIKNNIANLLLNPEFKQNAADWEYNHDARRVMSSMPDIVGHDFESTGKAIAAKTQETGQAIGDTIKNSQASAQAIGLQEKDIVGHIDNAISELNKADPNGNAATINKLMQKRMALTNQFDKDGNIIGTQNFENMTPQQAFDFKMQKLGNIKYTGNDATDTAAVNSALQKSRSNLTDKMNTALPELKPLNQDYGDLLSASDANDRAAYKAQAQGLGNMPWRDIITAGVGKWLFTPSNRIKMAQFLYNAPKADIEAIGKVIPDFQDSINKVYALPSPSSVAEGQTISQKAVPLADASVTKEIPQYLKDRQNIPPLSVGKSSSRPEAFINNTNPSIEPKNFTETAQNNNIGPYTTVNPSAMDALIKAHREVDLGNVQQEDVQGAVDMANHFSQNNVSQTGLNVKKFNDLNSLNKYVGNNESKIELISTDADGNFYAHLKQEK